MEVKQEGAFPITHGTAPNAAGGLSKRSTLVLYGSETGNGQDIAEDLGRTLERHRFWTSVEEMNDVELRELVQYGLVIFVISTTGQGDMPQNATKFWKSLLRKKLPPTCLTRVKFSSFALGDSSYPRFNWAGRKLHKRLTQLGAREFFASGEGDERHDDGIDTVYLPWYQGLKLNIMANYPLPYPLQPIPVEEALPPRYPISIDAGNGRTPSDRREAPETPQVSLPKSDSLLATVRGNLRVTPADHWQDVRFLTLDIARPRDSWNTLQPGATLVIYPKNSPADVNTLIERMDWQAQADLPLRFYPVDAGGLNTTSSKAARVPKGLYQHLEGGRMAGAATATPTTLRDLLMHSLDITAVPKRGFLEKLFFMTSNELEKERLRELADPVDGAQEFYDYASRPRRTILEILGDFPCVKVPLEAALDVFPLIRGREFSIAGASGDDDDDNNHGGVGDDSRTDGQEEEQQQQQRVVRVEILAALLEYRTIIRKARTGLCSRYLKTLTEGAEIGVTLKPGSGLGEGLGGQGRPVIAVATGTGIAPIRMLIRTRLARMRRAAVAEAGGDPVGEMLLFFGCRNRRADYYFADEWCEFSSSSSTSLSPSASPPGGGGGGLLTVIPAFSRDPPVGGPDGGGQDAGGSERAVEEARSAAADAADPTSAAAVLLRRDKGRNYVQHHIRRHAAEVAELVRRGAVVCVCGSAGDMPRSVRMALQDALVAGGLCADPAGAEEYLATKVDVWQETW